MVIGEHTADSVTLLLPRDRLTVETFGALKSRASRLVDDGRLHVVLNLKYVPYVDSIGIAELVRIHLMLERCGGRLALSHLNRAAAELLRLTRLTDILNIFTTEVGPDPVS